MYPYELFTIFGSSVNFYGIFVGFGIFSAFILFTVLIRNKKIPKKVGEAYSTLAIITIVASFGSAMLMQGMYNLIALGKFTNSGGSTGMTFLGGLVGGVITFTVGGLFFTGKEGRKYFPQITEIAAPSLTLGHALGRIGCFMVSCSYGIQTDSVFGMEFIGIQGKVYPTQLFESIFLFLLTGVLLTLVLKNKPFSLITYLYGYGIFRFLIEFIRGDYRGALIPGLTPSQVWSIALVIAASVLLYLRLSKREKSKNINTGLNNFAADEKYF